MMQIEYLQCVSGADDVSFGTIGTIFVWFPKETSSEDRDTAWFVRQMIKDLSLGSDPIYQAIGHEHNLPLQGFWADIPADKWHAVLATLSFSGGTEIFGTEG